MKKGVSPIIAGMLLIALTIGIAAVVSNVLTGFTREQTSAIQSKYKVKCSYISADFDGDPVVGSDASGDYVKFNIYNNGQEVINSTKQIAVWSDGTTTTFNGTINLPLDGYASITLYNNTNLSSGVKQFSSKTLSRFRISVDACKGSPIEWKSE